MLNKTFFVDSGLKEKIKSQELIQVVDNTYDFKRLPVWAKDLIAEYETLKLKYGIKIEVTDV